MIFWLFRDIREQFLITTINKNFHRIIEINKVQFKNI